MRRRWVVTAIVTAVSLVTLLGLLIVQRDSPVGIDDEWLEELLDERGPWWDVPALFMDWLGGGIVGIVVVPIAIIVVLLVARRPWGALVFALASVLSAGLVQLLKGFIGRARPEDMLVTSDVGSFPSGHVANAATLAIVLALLFALSRDRWWVWMLALAYIVAMALSRTYLGVHWLTDTIAGAVLGAGVAVLVWLPFARRLEREPRAPRSRTTGSSA